MLVVEVLALVVEVLALVVVVLPLVVEILIVEVLSLVLAIDIRVHVVRGGWGCCVLVVGIHRRLVSRGLLPASLSRNGHLLGNSCLDHRGFKIRSSLVLVVEPFSI